MSTLDEIEARLAAATPGPWENDGGGEIAQHYSCSEPYEEIVSTQVTCGSYCLGGSSTGVKHHDDAELIAHAPADLADLLAVVRAVEALHKPGGTVIRETSYDMEGTIPGTVRLSGLRMRDLETCMGCSSTWPCPTAAAVQQIGGAS